jgi:hypothetical protein
LTSALGRFPAPAALSPENSKHACSRHNPKWSGKWYRWRGSGGGHLKPWDLGNCPIGQFGKAVLATLFNQSQNTTRNKHLLAFRNRTCKGVRDGIATSYGAGRPRGRSSSPGTVKNFLLSRSSRTALRPTQPPFQWVPGALSTGVKRSGREFYHSPPTSAEVKNMWIYTSTPHTPSWRSA